MKQEKRKNKINRKTLFIPFLLSELSVFAIWVIFNNSLKTITKIVEKCPLNAQVRLQIPCEIISKPHEMISVLICSICAIVILIGYILLSLYCEGKK